MRKVFRIKNLLELGPDGDGVWQVIISLYDNREVIANVDQFFNKINVEYFKRNLHEFKYVEFYEIKRHLDKEDEFILDYKTIIEEAHL